MLIGQVVQMIGKVLLEGVSSLGIIWSLSTVKSKLRLLCRLLKLNISLLEVVAFNFFG